MMSGLQSEALFWKHLRTYQEITFESAGYFMFSDYERFVLWPKRLSGEYVSREWAVATLDLFKARLAIEFHFTPRLRQGNVQEQLLRRIGVEVKERLLKPRRFYLIPHVHDVARCFENGGRGRIWISVKVRGGSLKGLEYNLPDAVPWRFFFPEDCAEATAIQSAIDAEGDAKAR